MERLKKLIRLEDIVYDLLTQKEELRKNDIKLVLEVLKRKGVDITQSFDHLANTGQLSQMESITRVRRKVQLEHPELKDPTISEYRNDLTEDYEMYSRIRKAKG